ncbi:MAG: hypothetical protein ACOZAL_00645 [Patescibacteria group bacterium]
MMSIFAKDSFLSKSCSFDKLEHFAYWCLLYLGLKRFLFLPDMAMITAFILGFLWEIKDIFRADGFSWRDLLMDIAGILVGRYLL